EISGWKDKYECGDDEYRVSTVYIGGGTPSVLEASNIEFILGKIRQYFDLEGSREPEITIEVNPGTVDLSKFKVYKKAGINRLSIGLQSANPQELKELGRIHDPEDFLKAYEAAAQAGFDNINVDIMTAIPRQTVKSLKETINTVISLKPAPTHISAYSLIIEEGTPFYEKYGMYLEEDKPMDTSDGSISLPAEEEERLMYHNAVKQLREAGYKRYEISNFAKPGYESRHNSAYWKVIDYIGLGLGASSLLKNVRYKNTVSLKEYLEDPCAKDKFAEKSVLEPEDRMDEFMILGLRMSEGVKTEEYREKFAEDIRVRYGEEIKKLKKDGLLKEYGGRIFLTERGIDYGNYVFSNFLKG
ncbi:MAG: radical SAM family heme chaperone HemW, partial [Lachnospiraceae bacterium]|nr:radical SAM family heme chaperone HemW [Lachnospiraceae bacterium]